MAEQRLAKRLPASPCKRQREVLKITHAQLAGKPPAADYELLLFWLVI